MAETESSDSKKAKSRKRYEIPKTATCNVCGDIAAEHLHYGGIACYSCRAFFRRTVNSNRPILECSNDLKCKIDKHTRKRCQFCRFEKCKSAGMKTSWVLTEDDKSKVAIRRPASSDNEFNLFPSSTVGSEPVRIKKEAVEVEPVFSGLGVEGVHHGVKQRRPSSPLSPPFKSPSHFHSGEHHNHYSGLSRQYQSPAYPGMFGPGPYNYPGPATSGVFTCPPGPANVNTMHVSLSTPADGLSLTIETGHGAPATGSRSHSHVFTKQEAELSPGGGGSSGQSGSWQSAFMEGGTSASTNMKSRRHHQQSRTIFRCVSGDNVERDCDSRSTVDSQMSDFSFSAGASADTQKSKHNAPEYGHVFSPCDESQDGNNDETGVTSNEHLKAQVWKLQDITFDNSLPSSGSGGGPPLSIINTFTLQETLFVEQLTSIDERVRFQVPMDVTHVKCFLDCAISGSPISQMTIMHAYQTCIKRIVRFANSLQDFVELPPDDMQKLLVNNTVSIINIKISRWLTEEVDLKTQMGLLGTGQDLYREALDSGRVTEDLNMKVSYSDIFVSPWCCDSSHEDRYETLIGEMFQLELDPTTVVLLSVMSLFFLPQESQSQLSAASSIASHQRKFSLLLQRYLLQSKGKDRTVELYAKYQESLEKLHEMAEILINKRLICW